MVQSPGAEFGIRCESIPNLRSTVSLWMLDLDSELVFNGDDGTTDASGATRRIGIEWANDWRPLDWLILDAGLSTSQAHYFDTATYGTNVPEAVADVASAGLCVKAPRDFKLRYACAILGPGSWDRTRQATIIPMTRRWSTLGPNTPMATLPWRSRFSTSSMPNPTTSPIGT